jgi:hypothetical protein
MRTIISITVLWCMVTLASTAHAGVLGPATASSLVEAYGDSTTPCVANTNFAAINVLQHDDNTLTPFAIPAGMVLVITEAEISGSGNPNDPAQVGLFRFTAPSTLTGMGSAIGFFDSAGNFSAHISFSQGAVVKSGTGICGLAANRNDGSQAALPRLLIHGYFAKDK